MHGYCVVGRGCATRPSPCRRQTSVTLRLKPSSSTRRSSFATYSLGNLALRQKARKPGVARTSHGAKSSTLKLLKHVAGCATPPRRPGDPARPVGKPAPRRAPRAARPPQEAVPLLRGRFFGKVFCRASPGLLPGLPPDPRQDPRQTPFWTKFRYSLACFWLVDPTVL